MLIENNLNIGQSIYKVNEKNVNYLFITLRVLVSFSTAILIFFYNKEPGYENIILLPITYGFIVIIFNKIFLNHSNHLGIWIFNNLEFLRYVIIPLVMVLTQFFNSRSYAEPSIDAKRLAIALMIYEIAVLYATIYIFCRKWIANYGIKKQIPLLSWEKKRLLFAFGLILVFMVFLTNFGGNSFRIYLFGYKLEGTENVYVFGEHILMCAKYLFFIYFIDYFISLYKKKPSKIYIGLIILVSILNIGLVFGDVRNNIVIAAIATYFTLFYCLGKKIRVVILATIALASLSSIYLTTYIDEAVFRSPYNIIDYEKSSHKYISEMHSYFSGPYNVASSIDTASTFENIAGPKTIIIDTIGFIEPIGYLIFDSDSLNHRTTRGLFNYQLYGYWDSVSQIIPMIGQGFIYFGFLGAPVIPLIFVLLLVYFEYLVAHIKKSQYLYIYLFALTNLGLMHMYNISIMSRHLFNYVLPVLLCLWIADKLTIKYDHGKILIGWSKK